MSVNFFSEDISKPKFKVLVIKKWLKIIADSYKKRIGNINYIFCSDEYLLKINREYLSHDYYTDIITFDYCEKDLLSGDIFISIERINENAIKYHTTDTELYRVIIHGLLHLIGFDDHSTEDKEEITLQEDKALRTLAEMLEN